jgi:hypothetical protein
MKQTNFEQGNQARLDVTREELQAIETACSIRKNVWLDLAKRSGRDGAVEEFDKYDRLLKKVREALDRYQ